MSNVGEDSLDVQAGGAQDPTEQNQTEQDDRGDGTSDWAAAVTTREADMGARISRVSAGLETREGTNWAPAPLTSETETGAGECWATAIVRIGAQRVRGGGSKRTLCEVNLLL